MTTIFRDIAAALDGHLNTMTGKPAIAWENKAYTPVKGTIYARPTNLQGDTFAETEKDRTDGIYVIDILSDSGEGKAETMTMADLIADRFKQDTEITYNTQTVRIKSVSTKNGYNTEGWYLKPINIEYYSFTARR